MAFTRKYKVSNLLREFSLFSFGLFFGFHSVVAESQGEYRVAFSESPLTAFVEAKIPVADGRLFMAAWGANQLPDGWATFLRQFQVRDDSDRLLRYESKPNGSWQLADGFTGNVRLTYKVDLSFTKERWPAGNEQAGLFQGSSLFLVSKSLFVVSDVKGQRVVRVEVPGTWKISTPWPTLKGFTNSFVAEGNDDLIGETMVVGRHTEYVFTEGNFTFILALLGETEKSRKVISQTMQSVLRNYTRVFTKTPKNKYLMTVFYSTEEPDAEAYPKSSAITLREKITKDNLILWGNTMAHELFHTWNGHAIRGSDYPTSQWFSEGFTEYFANLALVQQGLVSKDLFVKKMETHFSSYLFFRASPAFGGVTLKEAGSRKGRNRLGVYDGGWTVAFCLDLIIRDSTNNRSDLTDFMRLMYEKFGSTRKNYTYEDIVTIASEVADYDLGDFFNKFVAGNETLPVKDYLKRIAFEAHAQGYDNAFFIFESPEADTKHKFLQKSLLGAK
jgi:predicted metalloprotease with PDZ domain